MGTNSLSGCNSMMKNILALEASLLTRREILVNNIIKTKIIYVCLGGSLGE